MNVSYNGTDSKYIRFYSIVSVETIQLCLYRAKTAIFTI